MMKNVFFILLLFSLTSYETDSVYHVIKKADSVSKLNLKWNKAYPDDTLEQSIIGLKWGLSYMGAFLPKDLNGITTSGNIISIDINQLGFSPNALEKLNVLHSKIMASEEYQKTNTIDLGRYITLLLGAPEHYYEIIGTPKRLEDVLRNYTLKPEKGYVNNSGVSLENRIIQFSEQIGFNQLFLSKEVDSISQKVYGYETIELLSNGQVRFGIFDVNGYRKNSIDVSHSKAGKPAKCMWCHESHIQPLFYPLKDYNGFLTAANLVSTLSNYREANRKLKLELTDGVAFSQTQQHTLTELLYISFMEPSAERLSIEWGIPLPQVQNLLLGLPTHTYDEFPFLGNLYHRRDVESLAPFHGLPVSSSVREPSAIEVNYLN